MRLLTALIAIFFLLGCSKAVLVSTSKGNGESFSGTQYLLNLSGAIVVALARAAEHIAAQGASDPNLCKCAADDSSPACLALASLTASQVSACATFTYGLSYRFAALVREGRVPRIDFVNEAPVAPITATGVQGPVAAATRPGEEIRVHLGPFIGLPNPERRLGPILGHEISHHVNFAASGQTPDYPEDFIDPLDPAGNYLWAVAVAQGFWERTSVGGNGNNNSAASGSAGTSSLPPLTCRIQHNAGSPRILMNQANAPERRSSAIDITIVTNRAAINPGVAMTTGDFAFTIQQVSAGGIRMTGTLSRPGLQTMVASVGDSAGVSPRTSCQWTFTVGRDEIGRNHLYQLFNPTTHDRLPSHSTTEGVGSGWQYDQFLTQMYVVPTSVCAVPIYRVRLGDLHHLTSNPAESGIQGLMGYGCPAQYAGTAPFHAYYHPNNGAYKAFNKGSMPWVFYGVLAYLP